MKKINHVVENENRLEVTRETIAKVTQRENGHGDVGEAIRLVVLASACGLD